jgi:hypothetical protein
MPSRRLASSSTTRIRTQRLCHAPVQGGRKDGPYTAPDEQHIVADTAQSQFTLRQAIHRQLVDRPGADFATLNAWIYEHVFATPKADPWLGLNARTDVTGPPAMVS